MKYIVNFAFTFLICMVSFAQNIETITVKAGDLSLFVATKEYKYPNFLKTKVYLNNGDSARGKFNFNYFDQSMRFINEKGDTLAIANENEVNFVTIVSDTFFYEKGFYEWIATSSKIRLAVKHIFKFVGKETPGPLGITSMTSGVQNIDKFFAVGSSYNASPNEVLLFLRETTYYISTIKGLKNEFVIANKKNISRLLPKKKVEDFIQKNKLNLNKEEDLLKLFINVSQTK